MPDTTWITQTEAEELGLTKARIAHLRKIGRMPIRMDGNRILVRLSDAHKYARIPSGARLSSMRPSEMEILSRALHLSAHLFKRNPTARQHFEGLELQDLVRLAKKYRDLSAKRSQA